MVSSLWINFQITTIRVQSKHLAMKFNFFLYSDKLIKTHGCVSVAKKAVWHTSVLITGIANLPFSTPRISITTTLISMKFTYFMHTIHATLHTKFEGNWPSSSGCENCSIFTFFFFFAPFYKSNFEPTKTPFSWIYFFQLWHTYYNKALCGLS